MPDRGEDLKQVGAGDLGDRHLADAWEGIPPQARHPLALATPAAPAVSLLFQHTRGSFGDGGYAAAAGSRGGKTGRKPSGGVSLLLDRVDVGPGHDVEGAVGNDGGAVDGVAEVGFVDESFLASRLQNGEVTVLVSQHDLAVDHEG